jgi:putative membrane protein
MRKKVALAIAISMALWLSSACAADVVSQAFIRDAIEGNLAEVQVGKLAQEKGQNDQVRSFGRMLESDHANANHEATSVADLLGVIPPTQPNEMQRAVYDKLSKLSGAEFDRQFVRSMIEDHEADVRKFESEANKNDQAAEYAKQTLPALRQHLRMAETLMAGGTTGSR